MFSRILFVLLLIAATLLSSGVQAQFYIGPNGSDTNSGTLNAPFATFARAQQAMQNSSVKTTYVMAGTYHPAAFDTGGGDTVALYLSAPDAGQTWSYNPPDGYGSAIIDGGSSSATTGIKTGFTIDGASGVSVVGLQYQNFAREFLHSGNNSPNTIFAYNIVHGNYDSNNTGGITLWQSAQNSSVIGNVVYNIKLTVFWRQPVVVAVLGAWMG